MPDQRAIVVARHPAETQAHTVARTPQTTVTPLDPHIVPWACLAAWTFLVCFAAYRYGVRARSDQTLGVAITVGAAVLAVSTLAPNTGAVIAAVFVALGGLQAVFAEKRERRVENLARTEIKGEVQDLSWRLSDMHLRLVGWKASPEMRKSSDPETVKLIREWDEEYRKQFLQTAYDFQFLVMPKVSIACEKLGHFDIRDAEVNAVIANHGRSIKGLEFHCLDISKRLREMASKLDDR
jgi:hypothetical protein